MDTIKVFTSTKGVVIDPDSRIIFIQSAVMNSSWLKVYTIAMPGSTRNRKLKSVKIKLSLSRILISFRSKLIFIVQIIHLKKIMAREI